MQISLFAVLCATLCHSLSVVVVYGSDVSVVEMDEREMVTSFTFDASVMWYNDNALATDCTDAEQTFIMNRMAPNLDLILNKNGYSPVPWSKSKTKLARERFLRGAFSLDTDHRDLQSALCQTCIQRNSPTYCNALYNCGFRRTLTVEQEQPPQEQHEQHHREDQEVTASTTTTSTASVTAVATKIQTQFTSACTAQLVELSANVMLQDSCRKAVGGSVCQVTIA